MSPHLESDALVGAFKAFVFGGCLFLMGTLLQWRLAQLHVRGILFFLDNILLGIVAGLTMLLYERHRAHELKKKAETIQLMNNHVRNALQVISASSHSIQSEKDTTRVYDAVRRIELGTTGSASRSSREGKLNVTLNVNQGHTRAATLTTEVDRHERHHGSV